MSRQVWRPKEERVRLVLDTVRRLPGATKREIMNRTGLTHHAIYQILAELVDTGHLTVPRRDGAAFCYEVSRAE